MALFNWVKPDERKTSAVITDAVGDRFGPRAILRALEEAVRPALARASRSPAAWASPYSRRAVSNTVSIISSPRSVTRLGWSETGLSGSSSMKLSSLTNALLMKQIWVFAHPSQMEADQERKCWAPAVGFLP
jgi:hypothetical protein